MLPRLRSRWASCCLMPLRILLMRGRFFLAIARNCYLAFLRGVRGLAPNRSLTGGCIASINFSVTSLASYRRDKSVG